ncbi:AdeC/AdeK/OprM family multidrug efflux complex outer membrane factor [Geobacter sp. DSM 9736]|uniref:AdeC/AdeK/OprM family multidrug efflux complex outer membrane factor n=1 Tax=Geobacter sp. DSM 9736 TaxID=1277350 RepID=UPI000B513F3F|nr:AdeC/AdeK/OprM family multidrug efflux complex outer membrane factor [Geobacter sp. DSM 9736]SNB47108.1 outer membrane protein, multidrug efflux system [Geobacter sp. DSM 9736]
MCRTKKLVYLSLVTSLLLAGCSTMAPKYTRPETPVASAWPSGPAYKAEAVKPEQKPLAEIPWKEFFIEPQLQNLIGLAIENNRDLRVAVLNIERFRAQYQIRRADLVPNIAATAGAGFQRVPEDLSATGEARTVEQYDVGLGMSYYELDLFGRVRSLKDQALEQYLATEHARRSVQIALVSQVATAYLTLASDRERLKLARETLANQEESYKLTKSRFDAGISSALDLQQARTSVDAARVDIARFTTLAAQDENLLNLVVGRPVPAELLPQALSEKLTALKDLTPGLPSDVLLTRPDILQAEGVLKGANANIGAARAAFFPRITLLSSVGFGSDELSGLFKGGSFTWSFAPRVTVPIFEGGRNRANLKAAEVDTEIAVAQYEKAIQVAFREVADALAQRGTIEEQVAAQQSLTDATAETHRLSTARYEKGVDSYLSVLDSQRTLYGAQQNLISVRLARLANLVTLYKVLGGGVK